MALKFLPKTCRRSRPPRALLRRGADRPAGLASKHLPRLPSCYLPHLLRELNYHTSVWYTVPVAAGGTNMRPPLTTRQREVLEYISQFMARVGYPPTVREIGAHFNFVPGSISDHLKALQRKGYVRRDPAKSRTLQILAAPPVGRSLGGQTLSESAAAPTSKHSKQHSAKKTLTRSAKKTARSETFESAKDSTSHYPGAHKTGLWSGIPSGHDADPAVREQLRLYSEDRCIEKAVTRSRRNQSRKASLLRCSGYEPLASTWDGEDAELLEQMLNFYPHEEPRRILDATVNGGRFWRGSRRPIVGLDLEAKHHPSLVGDNARMPFQDHVFDVVVYDPPHIPNQGRDKSKDFNVRFGLVLRSAKEDGYSFVHTYPPFLREAHRVLKPEGILFCKISDYIHDHRYQWAHVDLIQAARGVGFFPCDCIIKIRKGPIIDPKWKTAHHSRRQHCYWLVFRKSEKCE